MNTNRIPLVIGVTGHRDLRDEDIPPLEEKVGEILAELKETYAKTPVVLLSSLAEGADRLAARVALKNGIQLTVPLPMPVDDYCRDFPTEASRREFQDLLEQAAATFVLPHGSAIPPEREEQYARAGQYVLRHCHILLALWDGDATEKTGGTSQIIRHKLSGFSAAETSEWTILHPPDSGTVYHVATPRKSNPAIPNPYRLTKYHVDPRFSEKEPDGEVTEEKAAKIFTSLLERTDAFNGDAARLEMPLEAERKKSRAALDPGPGRLPEALEALPGRFAIADVLAAYFQKKRQRSLFVLCLLAFESPVWLANYHTVSAQNPATGLFCLVGFFATIIGAFVVHRRARHFGYESKHLDYRALAEGLKILFFWRLAGIHDDVGAQYLRQQRSEIDWIRLAVRATDLSNPPPGAGESPSWIKAHWMEHQLRYFDRSAARNGELAERCKRGAELLLQMGLALAAIMLIVLAWYFCEHQPLPEKLGHIFHSLSVAIVGLLAAGGSITAYGEQLAFVQQSKQYGQMRRLFALAIKECEACLERGEPDHVRTIIRKLGHEALRENGNWVLLHRERPMEIKVG